MAGRTLIVLGIVHLATTAQAVAQPGEAKAVFDAMGEYRLAFPGPKPTMLQLYFGFGLTMALGLLAFGTVVVLVARRKVQAPGLLVPVLAVAVAYSGIGLGLAVLFFPLPPLVGMAVALVAGLYGLVSARRATRIGA